MTKHSYISLWKPFLFKPPQYACTGMLCACIGILVWYIFVCACVRDRRVGEREEEREIRMELRTQESQTTMEREPEDKAGTVASGYPVQHCLPAPGPGPAPMPHRLLRAVKMFLLSLRINGFRIAEIVENTTCALMSLFSTKKGCQSLRCHNTSGVLVLWLSYQALVCRQD